MVQKIYRLVKGFFPKKVWIKEEKAGLPIAKIKKISSIIKDIKQNGGITLNLPGNKDLGGQRYIAVSPYPNRRKIIKGEVLKDILSINF